MSSSIKENLVGLFKRATAKRVAAGAGVVAAVGVATAMVFGTAAAVEGLSVADPSYPDGTTAIADDSTMDSYKLFPTGAQSTSYETTQYAGRLWTDKTVTVPTADNTTVGTTATFNFADSTHDLDPTDSVAAGKYEVDKTASGTFLTSVSVLSSSLTTELVEPVPLDIVLVLDVSGSMREPMNAISYTSSANFTQVSANQVSASSGNGYYIRDGNNGTFRELSYTVVNGNTYWYYTQSGYGGTNYYWVNPGTGNGAGQQSNNYISGGYSRQFYRLSNGISRMDQLKTAVNGFVDIIAQNNTTLENQGYTSASMSNIAVVKFAGDNSTQTWDGNANTANNGNNPTTNGIYFDGNYYNYTQVAAQMATITNDNKTALENRINNFQACGATSSDYAMAVANGVFDSSGRNGVQKVVVFFTDGSPTHASDFDGTVANDTISSAKSLKDDGALVYTVGVFDGVSDETPTNASSNENRFMHAVSSNYPGATGYTIEAMGDRASNSSYYIAATGDLAGAFAAIAADISSGGGEDSTATGRDGNTAVTITDYLGDYMEFKGLDGILYGVTADSTKFYAPGTQGAYHEQAQVQRDDASATQSTYTMWPKDLVPSALLHPEEGQENVSLNGITVKVTRSTDPKTGDTVTITVPPELIPSLRYAVEQKQSGGNITTTSTRTDADPLRIFYSVGPKASTVSSVISQLEDQSLRSEDATNESDRQSAAFKNFMESAAEDGEDGIYKLYSNTETTGNQGTATVNMTLSENNPYYYYVDEPLYVIASGSGDSAVYRKATSADASAQKYVRTRYWTVGNNPTETSSYSEWNGASELNDEDGVYYIPNGTARSDANVTNVSIDKASGANKTETATTSLVSTFAGGNATTASQYLGNNGMLSIPVLGTLAVTKNIMAGEGFDLPADPVPSASFALNLKDKNGAALTQQNTYRALIRDAAGHPIDPTTHAVVTSAESAKFYVVDGAKFELRDGETLKVTNLPDGATYQATEDGQPGYQATVTDNTGASHQAERGSSASTSPAGQGN